MRHVRAILSAITILAATLGGGVVVTLSMAEAQGSEEAERLNEQAWQLYQEGRYADAEPLVKRELAIEEKGLGPDHPNVAVALNFLAVLYREQGRYTEAEPLYKRSLAIREKALGPDHPDVAVALNNLGSLYQDQGRYADAEPLLKRSLAIKEKRLGADHPNVASTLDNLGSLYQDQGRYADAEPLFRRSLAIREKALGPDHPDVAMSLYNLAKLYLAQGRYADAEQLYKRSLAIQEKALGPDHPYVATDLNELAELYLTQGRYADAEPLFRRSLAIAEKRLGADHPYVATTLNNLGSLYKDQGRYTKAEPLFKRALAIEEKGLGPDHPNVATDLNNLAELYLTQGRYTEAEPLYKRSLAIREKALGPDHPDVAEALNNLGSLYQDQGRYTEAEPLYKRSLVVKEKALGPNHPNVATILNNLATLYTRQDRYADAEPLFKRALAIEEKGLGPDHPNVATDLNNLAALYDEQGRYAEAEPLYKRALAIREKSLGPDHPDVGQSLNNLAALYDEQGRYAEAEPLYKRALAIREKSLGPDHPDVGQSLNNLAALYDEQGRYADALPIIRRTIREHRSQKSAAFPVLLGLQKAKLITPGQAFSDSYNVLQFTSSSAAAEAVNKLAQRYAAGTGELAGLVREDQDLAAESGRVDKALIGAVSKAPNERNQAAEDQMRNRLAEITVEKSKLAETLAQRFPDYVALSKPQPLTLAETQKLLADDEAVVAFDVGEGNSYAWVVTKSDAFWTEIPTTSKVLNEQVQQLRQSLTFKKDKPFDAVLAHKIYEQTFGLIATKIAGKKRLSVIANGALTSIPFALLVASDPAGKSLKETDWLVKSYAITVIPSIYSLKTMRAQAAVSSAPKPMIAFADPVFSKQAYAQAGAQQVAMRSLSSFYQGSQIDVRSLGEQLVQLPSTRDEVQAIAKSLRVDKSDIKLGLNATVTAVKHGKLDQYRIVYFATHGLVAGELEKFNKAKAEPALVLSIPDKPTDEDDGLLQASEVAQLKLNADWVVLSACNTASAEGVGAEPLSGLARAFLYAGARSLVVSHWDVSDEATPGLMSNLFDISAKKPNLSHGEALREATLKLLEDAKTNDDAHPRMWAPFVVVGEPAKKM
jgi:tetratricopeptide (TPR) repeat protein